MSFLYISPFPTITFLPVRLSSPECHQPSAISTLPVTALPVTALPVTALSVTALPLIAIPQQHARGCIHNLTLSLSSGVTEGKSCNFHELVFFCLGDGGLQTNMGAQRQG